LIAISSSPKKKSMKIWWLFFNVSAQMEWKQNYVCFHIKELAHNFSIKLLLKLVKTDFAFPNILLYGHQPTWQWIGVSEGSLLPSCNHLVVVGWRSKR
jgi:hypothetical protein